MVYEQLVDDFETEARRLMAACGLEWEPACLRFHQTARPVRTASVMQVRQPLYRTAVARWKHYEGPLADLFARLRNPARNHESAPDTHNQPLSPDSPGPSCSPPPPDQYKRVRAGEDAWTLPWLSTSRK